MRARPDVRSVTLHQQDGSLTLQAFADREGLTLQQVSYCVRKGLILCARKDARSKKWTIYPPAKLLRRPCQRPQRSEGAQLGVLSRSAELPNPLAAVPPFGRSTPEVAAVGSGCAERSAPQAHPRPSTDQQAPQGRAAGEPAAICVVLTEAQRADLAYAATCQLHDLTTCAEADEPEVQEARQNLYAALRLLESGRPA